MTVTAMCVLVPTTVIIVAIPKQCANVYSDEVVAILC